MAGTMIQADLVADLKASLMDSANVFTAASDGDFKRHLDLAALDFGRFRPRTMKATLTLVADQAEYDAPADFKLYKSSLWGMTPIKAPQPWEKGYPGKLPYCEALEIGGVRKLFLYPTPTAAQIAVLGSVYIYFYYAKHVIDAAAAASTTIQLADRGLLLLRAQAEAMKEMTVRNSGKPVAMRDGLSGMSRNSTPAALYEMLMRDFERMAA